MNAQERFANSFKNLTPETILTACEEMGFHPTGEMTQLNSYENRVYDVRIESEASSDKAGSQPASSEPTSSVIAKFYRPGRWSAEAIQNEHQFLSDLKDEGIPAIAPFAKPRKTPQEKTEFSFLHEGFITAIFPKTLGRMPQEFIGDELRQVGRLLARLHNVGAKKEASHRPHFNTETYGDPALERLEHVVYPEIWPRYRDAAEYLLGYLDDELTEENEIRIHGDCHKGNLLLKDSAMESSQVARLPHHDQAKQFYFVDFDDCCNGPAAQDFFMLLSGSSSLDADAHDELEELLSGYEELRAVPKNLYLLEPLRGLRILHYAGWIAARWSDPFFPSLFPDFLSYNWWADECLRLEQIANRL